MIPTLTTQRLILRAPRLEDFEPYAAIYASDRAVYEEGPLSRDESWKMFAASVGLWTLRGYGPWSVEDCTSGAWLGEVGVFHFANYPEAEIGWRLAPQAEGRGIAFEAAQAARAHAYRAFGLTTLVSYIDPRNARSIRLARRLGAVRDYNARGANLDDLVFRHPGPAVVQEACA